MNQLLEYRSKLVDRLEAAPVEFRKACQAVNDPYQPLEGDGWNAHQLAAHTRDVHEMVYGMRIRRTAQEDNPLFENFDGEAWMDTHYSPNEPLASILDDLSASVGKTVSLLRDLPPEGWTRESAHEIYGDGFALQTWVERALAHIREHGNTIKKMKKNTEK